MPQVPRFKDIATTERGSTLERHRNSVFLSVEARIACIGTRYAEMNIALFVEKEH
jgi:hypothetical protein